MVLETPLLRVSRPVAACSRCRASKVKCDGKLPSCSACEKNNHECSNTNDQFARGKERSYVTVLETRVEKLEKKIAEARARRKSSTILMNDYSEAATPRPRSAETVKPVNKRAALRKEAMNMDELESAFGLLAVNATARDFYGFTSAMTYARLILAASSKEPLPDDLTKALPPKFAATPLVQHYLTNIYTLLPFFDEAAFFRSVDAVYHPGTTATASAMDHWNVRMVLAVSCLSQSEQRGDTLYLDAVGHVNAALRYKEEVLHPGRIGSIQALLLLVEYAMMDPHHFDSWTLIGAASRLMVDLGIHQEPSRSLAISKAKLELRRRVYWCVYALDRSTSLVQTRAFSFSDDSANVALPFNGPATSPRNTSPQTPMFQQSFGAALDLFKIRELQSEWYMELFQSGREPWAYVDAYPYIWSTYAKMTQWFKDLPTSLLPSQRSFFELELLYSYVYILSKSPRIPHIHEYAQRLIFEHCIAYATSLLALISQASNTTKPPITFYDAMRAYMTGRQFVDVLRNPDALLDPVPALPPASSIRGTASDDPLAPSAQAPPPPFPSPVLSVNQTMPKDPTTRAIDAINDFTTILSKCGNRFGFTHWRDRFQRESAALLAQLYNRASNSPNTNSQHIMSHTGFQQPQAWIPSGVPNPNQQASFLHQHQPTTPPSVYPAQPGSFSSSPFAQEVFGAQTQTQQQMAPDWTTPPLPSQPVPGLPSPSEGRMRHALLYGPGLPPPRRPKSATSAQKCQGS
ncbi:uncharacterized protein EI97DRAFT_375131 [Westerdykella ornata]|uniref:Zn(2)-C6 fungal-type domain-containing protein n=1 Tax=Westerdykella ornata TaxID=318751 RepID=A0A6A6JN21_WESOR|nr:uncharacterized protein EI97DRAFT_375131 [Westerdykella ornata]KAF2277328.1 hypothetical protein EI97DRAFT_375131 [Westerdykella ornata]